MEGLENIIAALLQYGLKIQLFYYILLKTIVMSETLKHSRNLGIIIIYLNSFR